MHYFNDEDKRDGLVKSFKFLRKYSEKFFGAAIVYHREERYAASTNGYIVCADTHGDLFSMSIQVSENERFIPFIGFQTPSKGKNHTEIFEKLIDEVFEKCTEYVCFDTKYIDGLPNRDMHFRFEGEQLVITDNNIAIFPKSGSSHPGRFILNGMYLKHIVKHLSVFDQIKIKFCPDNPNYMVLVKTENRFAILMPMSTMNGKAFEFTDFLFDKYMEWSK